MLIFFGHWDTNKSNSEAAQVSFPSTKKRRCPVPSLIIAEDKDRLTRLKDDKGKVLLLTLPLLSVKNLLGFNTTVRMHTRQKAFFCRA